ncbi:MAG: hypothetical protein WBG19_01390 [Thermoplasmata archaeon]
MAQFIVRAYRTPRGYRVVVDGMTHFDVEREEEIDPKAREAILERLRAFLPPRAPPPFDPDALSTLLFSIALEPAGSGGTAAPSRPFHRLKTGVATRGRDG